MAQAPSIDDAFDALVVAERVAGAAVFGEAADVSIPEAYAAFSAALASRGEFFKATSEWVQYAVDDRVLTAICEQLGSFLDAVEVHLATLASVPRDQYAAEHLLLPASRLGHFAEFMVAARAYKPADPTVIAVQQQVRAHSGTRGWRQPAAMLHRVRYGTVWYGMRVADTGSP